MNKNMIDARGLKCPMPLLKLKQALAKADIGDQLELIAQDRGAWRDVPAYLTMTSHQLVSQKHDKTNNEYQFIVIKGEEV